MRVIWTVIHSYALFWAIIFLSLIVGDFPPRIHATTAHTMAATASLVLITWQLSIILTALKALFGVLKRD